MNPFRDLETEFDLRSAVFTQPRSVLFSLSPGGVGTPLQESLRSFLVRTSRAHSVSPRRLIGEVFGREEPAISKLAYSAFFHSVAGTVNGLGQYAELFVTVTARLMGLENIRHLTLLPWQGLFPHNGQGLLARHPRWCPVCLYQQLLVGQAAMFPLKWSMEAYRACAEHSCALEDRCAHCGKLQPHFPGFPDIGACNHCHRPLAGVRPAKKAPQFELWVSEAIGDMVMHQSEPGFAPTVGRFRDFVREQVESLTAGNGAAFCRALGFNDRGLNGWLNKGERPALPQFLALCYGVSVMPTDIFTGSLVTRVDAGLRFPPSKLKSRAVCPRPTPLRRQGLEECLRAQLHSDKSAPVVKIAADLTVSASCLRYWFPELCALLSEKYKAIVKARSEIHQAQQSRRVEEVVRTICAEGRYPSRRLVNSVVEREGMSLARPHLLQAYLKAVGDA